MLYRLINIIVTGVVLVLASSGFAQDQQEKKSDLTMSAVWSLFGYARTADQQQQLALINSENQEEIQNPLYAPEDSSSKTDPTKNASSNQDAVAVVAQPSQKADDVAASQPLAAQANEAQDKQPGAQDLAKESGAAPSVPAALALVPEVSVATPALDIALLESRIEQFSSGNQTAYQKAKDAHASNPKNTLLYYITAQNPEDYWLGLINFGLDNNGLSSEDLMWVIHEYARPYAVSHKQAEGLLNNVILAHLGGKNAQKIIDLLTSLSLQPYNTWSYTYDKNDRFNVLAHALELGYKNAKYTTAFKLITDRLPACQVDSYASVKLHVKNEPQTYNLAAWLLKDEAYYVVKKYDYAVHAAQHLFTRRLAAVSNDKPDLQADMVSLSTMLLRERLITNEDYAKASKRFIQ